MHHDRHAALRFTLFAALGLSPTACGDVQVGPPGTGGGTTTTTSTTSTTGSGMNPPPDPPPPSPCAGATLVLTKDGFYTGFARCPDGTVHRLEQAPCETAIFGPICIGNEESKQCTTDADCTAGPHGRCIHEDAWGNLGVPACNCQYACANDAECGDGLACLCKDVVPHAEHSACIPKACAESADCPSGECGLSSFYNGCYWEEGLTCRAQTDVCRLDGDCANGGECDAIGSAHLWACNEPGCISGRPLMVDGAARTAPRARRDDWQGGVALASIEGLAPALREALAQHWGLVAAMEHASVGSFARFTLELLSLGAPPDLLADTQRAAADEVEHARLAYGLASAFAGRAIGPGPLDLGGLVVQRDRRSVLGALIEEACVGETLAAAEVAAIAEGVADPALRAALGGVAEDELRHAALGFRALRWMLRDADGVTRAEVTGLFEAAMARASREPTVSTVANAPEHGLCAAGELGAVRRSALREIVRPLMTALLGEHEEARPQPSA